MRVFPGVQRPRTGTWPPVNKEGWVHTLKINGHNVTVVIHVDAGDNVTIRVYNRHGKIYSKSLEGFPFDLMRDYGIIDAASWLGLKINGEWVASERTFYPFDLIEYGGVDLSPRPWRDRVKILDEILPFHREAKLSPIANMTEDWEDLKPLLDDPLVEGVVRYQANKPRAVMEKSPFVIKHRKS